VTICILVDTMSDMSTKRQMEGSMELHAADLNRLPGLNELRMKAERYTKIPTALPLDHLG